MMDYKIKSEEVKIRVGSTITKKLKEQGHKTHFKSYQAIAEWTIGDMLYGVNAEGDTLEEAYVAIRNKLRNKGIGITKDNVIEWSE